jgi:hypothetical protein
MVATAINDRLQRKLDYTREEVSVLKEQLAAHTGAVDDDARARLLRYVLRPPLAQERLTVLPSQRIRLTLKRPWSDGTSSVELPPLAPCCVPRGLRSASPEAHRFLLWRALPSILLSIPAPCPWASTTTRVGGA